MWLADEPCKLPFCVTLAAIRQVTKITSCQALFGIKKSILGRAETVIRRNYLNKNQ
jgi:hypothetical protein